MCGYTMRFKYGNVKNLDLGLERQMLPKLVL